MLFILFTPSYLTIKGNIINPTVQAINVTAIKPTINF